MVATEGSSQLSVYGSKHGADEYTRHGEAVADALGYGDEVGTDALMLVGEELTATSVAALDFVEDEHGVVARAGLAYGMHKLIGGQLDASHALNTFDDDGADIAFVNFGHHRGGIVQGHVGDVSAIVDGSDDFRIVRHLHSQRCTSVESFGA